MLVKGLFDGLVDLVIGWLGFGWIGVFLLFLLFNKDCLWVGDLLVGIWVICIMCDKLGVDLMMVFVVFIFIFMLMQFDVYGVYEFEILEGVLC